MQESVLDVYLKQQWNEKMGQKESKNKHWNMVEEK